MAEICDIGKCHQIATTEAVMRAKQMFDTLRRNDVCEENEAIQKKSDPKFICISMYLNLLQQNNFPFISESIWKIH